MRVYTLGNPTEESIINLIPAKVVSEQTIVTLDENGERVYRTSYGVTHECGLSDCFVNQDKFEERYFEDGYDLREIIDKAIAKFEKPENEEESTNE